MQPATQTEIANKKLYLIDGYGFLFRAYHALPPLSNSEGVPVGAVYGFTNILIKLLREHKPDYMAMVFDSGKETFRNKIYPEYKAHRPPPPEDLIPQFSLVREAAQAAGLKTFELPGFEADDIIATFSKRASELGIDVTIVSTDKDLMQLVTDKKIQMFDPVKQKFIGEKEVIEKFGVPPEKVLDVAALIGDSSDNVPGVPSIGPKTAAELINQFGDLDTLLARAEEIKQNKRREVMLANKEQALMSRELIKLDSNVPLDTDFHALEIEKNGEENKLLEFAKKHGFKTIVSKLGGAAAAVENPGITIQLPLQTEFKRAIISTAAELEKFLEPAFKQGKIAFDFFGNVGIALCLSGASAFIKFENSGNGADLFSEPSNGLTRDKFLEVAGKIFADLSILKITHDYKHYYSENVKSFDDLAVIEYVLGTGLTDGSLEDLAADIPNPHDITGSGRNRRELKDIDVKEMAEAMFPVIEFIYSRHTEAKQRLFADKLLTVYEKMEKPLISILAKMERRGAKIDEAALAGMSGRFTEKLAVLEAKIFQLSGAEFNIGSPQQLGEVLFGKMGLPGGKKSSKTGAYSTGATILDDLAEQGHEIAELILEWRQLSKLKSTYTDALPKQINLKTGRVHTTYQTTATSTGRLSSTEPNLQNIPIRSEEGRQIRKAFIAEKGKKLISADYSQIELRLLADVANIEPLKQAFKNGQDIHAITAHQVLGVPMDQITSDHRRIAKTINFGIIYGVSAHGLSWRLKIPREAAKQYIDLYFQQYPGIKEYMRSTVEFCKKYGYVLTPFGRRCYIKGINDKNGAIRQFSERAAINAPLQGGGADIIKKAMVELERKGLPMILQVHDELVFEVLETEAEDTAKQVKAIMENAAMLSVPLLAEAHIGNNWGEVH